MLGQESDYKKSRISIDQSLVILSQYKFFEINYGYIVNEFVKKELVITNNIVNILNTDCSVMPGPVRRGFNVSAAYIIKHREGIYVGSTLNINHRMGDYENDFYNKCRDSGTNINLFNAYMKDPNLNVFFLLTETRDEAYSLEQWLFDKYWDTGLLFNKASDSRDSLKNHQISNNCREKLRVSATLRFKNVPKTLMHREKISLGNKGKNLGKKHKLETIEIFRKQRVGKKDSPETIMRKSVARTGNKNPMYGKVLSDEEKEQKRNYNLEHGIMPSKEAIEKSRLLKIKPITINEKRYNSITEAALELGIDNSTISRRLDNPNFNNYVRL
jgi:group I intron endonuclease